MNKNTLPKIALGVWAWGNDGTFGNTITTEQVTPAQIPVAWAIGKGNEIRRQFS